MEIRFLAENVAETAALESLFTPRRDKINTDYVITFQWSAPHWQSGLWGSLSEWICCIDISSIPLSIATGFLTNYLWDLVQRGKGKQASQKGGEAPPVSHPFDSLSSAKFVLSSQAKQIEFDPLSVDYGTIEILVGSFLDEKDAPQSPDR